MGKAGPTLTSRGQQVDRVRADVHVACMHRRPPALDKTQIPQKHYRGQLHMYVYIGTSRAKLSACLQLAKLSMSR